MAGSVPGVVLAAGLFAGLPVLATDDDFSVYEADEARLRAVNAGDLQFLPDAADVPLQSDSRLRISAASLDSGWVALDQCQRGLDAVEVAEIVYAYKELRNLEITERAGIGDAWVEGGSVQLRGVRPQAHVCIRAQVRILRADGNGGFRIDSGPYHRRYLDGYFPLRLSLQLVYPAGLLQWQGVDPPPRPGLQVDAGAGRVDIDARFTGRLTLHMRWRDLR